MGIAGLGGAGTPVTDRVVLATAAAVELAHNFTLLHDDVIDRDRTRRHRPTAWTVFGAENAILAGDALLALALRLVGGEAASRLAECVIEICDGQYEDCSFEQRDDVTLDECLAMAGKKTGALLGCACALGALAVRADPLAVAAMDLFGREIGMAFQLTDDLLGIWGDPAVTGKPVGSDLSARKKSLPVVAALSAGSAAAGELARLYALGRDFSEHEVRRATEAVERAGGRAWAATEATARVAKAHAHLRRAPGVDQDSLHDLRAIADLITRRSS
jgi:geranylgeranyl diphosphate synthase type I